MLSIAINEFPVPFRKPDGSIGQLDLSAAASSIVHNITVKDVPTPEPEFSVWADDDWAGAKNLDPITTHVEPVFGAGAENQRKLTFSGTGAPNGLLKDGAYILYAGDDIVARFQVLFGGKLATRESVMVDAAQSAAFAAAFGGVFGDDKYQAQFDAELDGSIAVTDSARLSASKAKFLIKK